MVIGYRSSSGGRGTAVRGQKPEVSRLHPDYGEPRSAEVRNRVLEETSGLTKRFNWYKINLEESL
jgi:hypothetical protein